MIKLQRLDCKKGLRSFESGVVETNSGSYLERDGGENSPHSFYPNDDWTSMSGSQLENFSLTSPSDFDSTVTLLDIDPYIRTLFWEKIEPLLTTVGPDVRKKALKNFSDEVVKRLNGYSSLEASNLWSWDIAMCPPNQRSTAYNHELKRYVGLHIDTHNVEKLDERRKGFHLCALNLGNSPRYFNFCELEVSEMHAQLEHKDYSNVRHLKDDFLFEHPKQKIHRIRIEPNQAYIAVSQNMIHDGSTSSDLDVAFLLGGYFTYRGK